MKVFAIRGHICVTTNQTFVVPMDQFQFTTQGTGVSFAAPVLGAGNIQVTTITPRTGAAFTTIDDFIDYVDECQRIAHGDGDPGSFVTMTTLTANSIQSVFLVAHGLGDVPSDYSAINLDSSQTSFTPERVVTADSTNIIITFDNPPISPNTARYRVSAKK